LDEPREWRPAVIRADRWGGWNHGHDLLRRRSLAGRLPGLLDHSRDDGERGVVVRTPVSAPSPPAPTVDAAPTPRFLKLAALCVAVKALLLHAREFGLLGHRIPLDWKSRERIWGFA
jgi:hypothetical protein